MGKGEAGVGRGTQELLENQINVTKYSLLFSNALVVVLSVVILSLCMWLRFEPAITSWVEALEANAVYIGIFILIAIAAVTVVVGLIGCLAALSENEMFTLVYVGLQVLCFIGSIAGAAVLMEFSSQGSQIGQIVRDSMNRLISNAQNPAALERLDMIQESISCCGANGPIDYRILHQPLPSTCRDTVTGNPFFHGCADEFTWFLEEKTAWISGIVMTNTLFLVVNTALAVILLQAVRKERGDYENYRQR